MDSNTEMSSGLPMCVRDSETQHMCMLRCVFWHHPVNTDAWRDKVSLLLRSPFLPG